MENNSAEKYETRTPEEILAIKREARDISKKVLDNACVEDKVNHPSHYTWLKTLCGIEVIDITRHMCFNLGNVVKYILRAGHKSEKGYSDEDKELEDLRKAKWYLEDEISLRSRTKITDTDIIRHHEQRISELQKQVEILSEANWHLRQFNHIGEMTLNASEVHNASEFLKKNEISDLAVSFRQTGTGIGIATELVYYDSNNNLMLTNITDYKTW